MEASYHDDRYLVDVPRGQDANENGGYPPYASRPRAQYGSGLMNPPPAPSPNNHASSSSSVNASSNAVSPNEQASGGGGHQQGGGGDRGPGSQQQQQQQHQSQQLSQQQQQQQQQQSQQQQSQQQQQQRPGHGRRMSNSSTMRGDSFSMTKDDGSLPPVGFDEGILRGLCEMDCALPLLADRIKQSVQSCKQVAQFFRDRSTIEERYSRSLIEMARMTNDVYSRSDGKAGSFVTAYQSSLRTQEQIAQNRLRFASRLLEMSEELNSLAREGEKQRKMHKDNGTRYQGILQESEGVMDKAKARFDATAEELERILVAKEGESYRDAGMRPEAMSAPKQRGLGKALNKGLFKGKNPAQMAKHEDDVRARVASASEAFRKAVLDSQALRQEYFNFQLPKIVRLLKDCADELDLGMQYHLTRFAFLYESAVVGEGSILIPREADAAPGLKHIFETIDNRSDFKSYMQNYAVARNAPKGPRREGLYDDGFVSGQGERRRPPPPNQPQQQQQQQQQQEQRQQQHVDQRQVPSLPPHVQAQQNTLSTPAQAPVPLSAPVSINGNGAPASGGGPPPPAPSSDYGSSSVPAATGATFGVDLGEQLARDGTEVPKVVVKCAEAIEAYGIESMGIYRISGTSSRVTALKNALDNDIEGTDVMDEQWSADINVVSGALKSWFRDLPEPLLTYGLYNGFVEAARYENDRLRHIRLHEQVNELPDPNYATLKYFMGHLDRIRRKESINNMSASNLSIVFGPTLLGAPPEEGGLNLEHMNYQCKAIETILEKYQEIFVEEDEGGDGGAAPAQAQA